MAVQRQLWAYGHQARLWSVQRWEPGPLTTSYGPGCGHRHFHLTEEGAESQGSGVLPLGG